MTVFATDVQRGTLHHFPVLKQFQEANNSVVNSAIFKSPSASSLIASPSPQNFKVTSPSPHATSPSP